MIKKTTILFLSLLLTFFSSIAQYNEQTMFTGNSGSYFGSAIAYSGDYLFVGSPWDNTNGTQAGLVTIYQKNGSNWTSTDIVPTDIQSYDRFGNSIDIYGNWAIIGASFNNDSGSYAGAAYFYHFNGTEWQYHSKIYANDASADDYFGCDVAIEGTTAVIGAYYNAEGNGAAYVFDFDGTDWNQTVKLMPADQSDLNSYGHSVDISGDNIVIGNPGGLENEGTAYIFNYDGSQWNEQQMIQAPTKEWAFFGESVSIDNDLIIVGQFFKNNGKGGAYAFRFNGTDWENTHNFLPSEPLSNDDKFGEEVFVFANKVAISAPGFRTTQGGNDYDGAVFIYEFDGSNWGNEQKIIGSNTNSNSNFGKAVINDDKLFASSTEDDQVYYFAGETITSDFFHVTPNGSGNFSGDSWQNAYAGAVDNDGNGFVDLQDLINAAPDSTIIWVAEGTYKPTTGTDREKSFSLRSGVTIYGGFNGTETALDERDFENNLTIFSGDIDNNDNLNANNLCESHTDINGDNSYNIFYNDHVDSTAIIDGCYFTGGKAEGDYPQNYGAAMLNYAGSTAFDHDRYVKPVIKNCFFIGNSATGDGIVYNEGSYGNDNNQNIGIAETVFENCTFKNNLAYNGGAICISANPYGYANVDIKNCKFLNNTANGFYGGAIEIDMGNSYEDVTGTIENSVFKGNSSNNKGGAIFTDGSIVEFKNCLFTGNSATYGGVAYFAGDYEWCIPIFMNCTFAANKSTHNDIYSSVLYNYSADVNFVNCNFWGNLEGVVNTIHLMGYGTTYYQNCNIQNSGGSSNWQFGQYDINNGGNIDQDPLFVNLPDYNNAPTVDGDFHLQENSPVIDLGITGSFSYTCGYGTIYSDVPTTDLDGFTREGNPDLGAYEFVDNTTTYTVTYSVLGGNGTLEASVDGTPITSGDEVEQGKNIEFTATPDPNYEVFQWIVNGDTQAETGNTFIYNDLQEQINVSVEFQNIQNIETLKETNISIYPNPTNGKFIVACKNLTIENISFVDINGKKIYYKLFSDNQNIEIDFSNQSAGIYFLNIQTNETIRTYKIIKK